MKIWHWILIAAAIIGIGVVAYVIVQTQKRKTLAGEAAKQQQDILQQKLENAPESRQEVLEQIDALKALRQPWLNAYLAPQKRRGTSRRIGPSGIKSPIPSGCFDKFGNYNCPWKDLDKAIAYYNDKITELEEEYSSLL